MLIVNKHCAILTNLYEPDTREGPEGVRLIAVSLYFRSIHYYYSDDEIRGRNYVFTATRNVGM